MRLIFDLRLAPAAESENSQIKRVALEDVAAAPLGLIKSLLAQRYDEVVVVRDSLPLSGVQSGIQVIAALMRADRYAIERDGQTTQMSRGAFLRKAILQAAVEVPREFLLIARLNRRAAKIGDQSFGLPSKAHSTSVAYLRGEPTLRWKGSFVGGAATHTTGVINGLARNGLDVKVYAAEPIPGIADEVPMVVVPPKRMLHLAHWMTLTEYSRDLATRAAKDKAGFVYQRYALGSYAGLELAKRLNVPFILEFNGSEIWIEKAWGKSKLRFIDSLDSLERRNLKEASLIVVVSDALKDQLVEQGVDQDRILSNPNGVEVERLAQYRAGSPTQWRSKLGEPEAPTIGFIGSFGLWHGVKLLPAMIDAVKQRRPDARWSIIGDGLLFAEVKAEIEQRGLSDQVTLTGIVEHERGLQHLAGCEICVSPHVPNEDGSRFFGSPTKLFEYMGLGKPIVASDLEQIGEVIEHERTGLLCTPGDVEEQANAIVRLLDDHELATRLGEAAFEDARAKYSWEAHVARILEAIGVEAPSQPVSSPAETAL